MNPKHRMLDLSLAFKPNLNKALSSFLFAYLYCPSVTIASSQVWWLVHRHGHHHCCRLWQAGECCCFLGRLCGQWESHLLCGKWISKTTTEQSRGEIHWPRVELTRLGLESVFLQIHLWIHKGPVLLTEAIMDFCKVGRQTGRPIIGHHKNCWNLSVFNHPAFYPLKANQRQQLFESEDDVHWRELFKDSYSVHFFGQLTSTRWFKFNKCQAKLYKF